MLQAITQCICIVLESLMVTIGILIVTIVATDLMIELNYNGSQMRAEALKEVAIAVVEQCQK